MDRQIQSLCFGIWTSGKEAEGQGEPVMVGAFERGEIWDDLYVLKPEQDKLQSQTSNYKI